MKRISHNSISRDSSRHTLHSTLYTPHFALYTLTLRTLHFTLNTPHSTFYTPRSTRYTPHSTLYTVHSRLCLPRKIAFHTRLSFRKCCSCHAKWHSHDVPHLPRNLSPLHAALTMQFAKNTSQSTLHTLHPTPCKLHSYTLHSTLYSWHSTLYMLRSTLHCTPPHSKLYTLQITLHRALLTALATQNSIPHTTDLHQMLRLPRKMTLSKLDGSLARNIDCEVGGFGVIRNELVGKHWFENLIKFEDVSHEMLVLRLQHLSSRFFGFLVVYMGKAAKTCHFISMVSNRLQCRFCTAVFFITSYKIHLKMPRLPRILHFATNWRSLTMRYSKKTRDATRLKCCACKMAMEDSKVLRRAAPATKNPTQLLKTTEKYCVCHTERLWTRYETCWNVTKYQACHAKSHAVFETSI